jgi:PPM family protein phosphatase
MTFFLHYALRSDVGLLREGNEDSAYAGPRLLAIADGMGGHAAGEVASAVAISAIAPLDAQVLISSEEMLDALASAVASARDTLHEMSESDPAVEGMGTTLTALLWMDDQVAVCHIGDSRAYLLRDGDLYQITRDHTLIQSLVDEGRLSPAAAANHPQRSLIIRALQGSTEADPDLAMHTAKLGDRYLLCSDGLTDVVGDEDVHEVLSTVQDADEAVGRLIALAIRNGGPDNITCIVADVVDESGPFPATRTKQLAGAAANGDARTLLRAATGHTVVASPDDASGPSLNGHAGRTAAAARDEDDDEEEFTRSRRRWPLVTSILLVLLLVVASGLYFGYRATQGQYYLAEDAGQISIFRGINEKIAFISLSSVYARTGVPISHLPGDLSLPTTPTTLAKSQATLSSIKRSYTCKQQTAALATWNSKYGTPPHLQPGQKAPATPPKPVVPSYCSTLGAG